MYDHQLIFTVVSFECGFIRGEKLSNHVYHAIIRRVSSMGGHDYKLWDGQ
jgi:hypothetical protein